MYFDAAEEILRLPAVAVVAAMEPNTVTAAALGRDTRARALPAQARTKIIGVEASVCHQAVPTGRSQHRERGEQIVALATVQAYGESTAPAIDYGGELRVESTFGSAHRLSRLSTRWVGAMLMEFDVRAVEVAQRSDRLAAKLSKDAGEHALAAPPPEPAVNSLPLAVCFGKVSPRTAGAQHEKNAAEHQSIIFPRSSSQPSGTFCSSPPTRAIRSIFLAAPNAARESSVDLNRTWTTSDCLPDVLFHRFSNTP
jgi:hypothetical protein